jgi:hypothetical protein
MFHPVRLGTAIALVALLVTAGCSRYKTEVTPASPPVDPVMQRVAFAPTPGMTRAEVEAVLGPPNFTGRTKEGLVLHTWRTEWKNSNNVDMVTHHSIEYDPDWVVVRTYR